MAQIRKMDCQVEVKSSAEKIFDAFNTKAHLMPKMSSRLISDIKLLEGEWNSPGSVRLWHYVVAGDKQLQENVDEKNSTIVAKELRESVDEKNRTMVYKLLDGEIKNSYNSWKTILSVTPKGEGSLVKWTFEYEKKNDDVPEPVEYCDFHTAWAKDVDDYLLNA
ncbi:hypothetical protein F3Y22_tig00001695pilonHSYRG00042 [Hibiscus syriacus]|uniref:Bet v I/Major latex protein domain-containing protein n=1 Tax=Hibiscus syriacus TaxID=106335 RepID=A0A6A3CUV9_HIBSY|nr:MLP-like protein 28 [Hibiscus syriacus]KAE8732896.1 hypothetical protein F3Y22_tig00001695pilonHSYRG00042 [Hibiscus syriacus]